MLATTHSTFATGGSAIVSQPPHKAKYICDYLT
jgi:hypothetical protein